MKRKINGHFMAVAGLAIVATLTLLVFIFHDLFGEQVMEDLRAYAYLLQDTCENEQQAQEVLERNELNHDEVRFTVISADGTVLFDNDVNASEMENHADRPEVKKAFETGEGEDVRMSTTLSLSTYYVAVALQDGSVVRVARETDSLWSLFGRAVPAMLVVLCLLMVVCFLLSNLLTKRLIRPIEVLAEHLDDPQNKPVYPELRPFVETIRSQHAEIMKSAKIRTEFTANVSHELKTPLTSISGYAELMESGMAASEDIPRFAGEIRRSAKRLLNLINDILRLSQLDSPEPIMHPEVLDLADITERTAQSLQLLASNNRVTLVLETQKAIVRADRGMMEELCFNLCDNAIRYNVPGGSVYVRTFYEKEDVVLSVRDTGIGIPKEHRERIFERFYRVDKSRSKATGGTGLGLAIVRHIVEQHEAELSLESEPGRGTCITVRFHRFLP